MNPPTINEQIELAELLLPHFHTLALANQNTFGPLLEQTAQAMVETLRKVKAEQDLLRKMSESFGGES